MALYKFDDFSFDSVTFDLQQRGIQVQLRPKVAQLLALLIENNDRLISKEEIFDNVWGNAYPRDHLLFQLISELRKPPFKAEWVRTQPNKGYRWNVATKEIHPTKFLPVLKVAACALLACSILSSSHLNVQSSANRISYTTPLPALGAFSQGVIAMENGETETAINWFGFALNENPDSVDSALFLAEALLIANRPEEASKYLYELLAKPTLSSYNTLAINDLLSRISQRQGQLDTAFSYAKTLNKNEGLAQCSSEVIQDRLRTLQDQLGITKFSESNDSSSLLIENEFSSPVPTEHSSSAYASQCEQLMQKLEETSLCLPEMDIQFIAFRRRFQKSILS